MIKQKVVVSALLACGLISPLAYATNGMNMAGYGPIAESMGGVSMAYDNGAAGMISNPATLGMMPSGTARVDIALGDLMPEATGQGVKSSAKNFYMPALGYVRKDNNLAWGVGVMAQGGMGTEYANSAVFGTLVNMGAGVVADPGLKNKSEVGIARVMFPLAFDVNDQFTIGGSIDYLWGGMDVSWLIDGAHFASLMGMGPAAGQFGTVSGSMVTAFGAGFGTLYNNMDYGYFDFGTGSKFTQKATTSGWAGNLGFTFKANDKLTIGGVYHAKTSLKDMDTGAGGATASFAVSGGSMGAATVPVTGQVVVHNFQWPETYGLGLAYEANDQWNLMADYKRINWAGVMKNFNMSFIADNVAANGGFAGTRMDLTYYQNWKNQDVIELGAAYKYSDALTLRFGGNFANNPIPNAYVTPLFPAIMKDHYTAGFGYKFSKEDTMDASFVYAPKVTATNNWGAAGGSNQTISLGGMSWQVMYSHRY